MRTEAQLVAAADQSFTDALRVVVRHRPDGAIRPGDGPFTAFTGVPFDLLNCCIVVEPSPAAEVGRALDWLAERGSPYHLFVAGSCVDRLAELAEARGLIAELEPCPGMVLHPVGRAPAPREGVEVVTIDPHDPALVAEFLGFWAETGAPPAFSERLYSPAFMADPEVGLFIGRLDGRAASTSTAIRSPAGSGISGIVAVATLPAARQRGLGTAVSWAAVEAGRTWGADTIVLQASAMGRPIYEAMGFRTVTTYASFRSPAPSAQ